MGRPFPLKNCPFLWGHLDPHLTHGSLGPPESTTQTADGSFQWFLHGWQLFIAVSAVLSWYWCRRSGGRRCCSGCVSSTVWCRSGASSVRSAGTSLTSSTRAISGSACVRCRWDDVTDDVSLVTCVAQLLWLHAHVPLSTSSVIQYSSKGSNTNRKKMEMPWYRLWIFIP